LFLNGNARSVLRFGGPRGLPPQRQPNRLPHADENDAQDEEERKRIERTSFAEAPEVKGSVILQLTGSRLASFEVRPLPARPMVTRTLHFDDIEATEVHARLARAIESTPDDAVVRLRIHWRRAGGTHRSDGAGDRRCPYGDARESHGCPSHQKWA
jgi:hypothetical protein